jgi:xanthine dehydrogenase accessory factor
MCLLTPADIGNVDAFIAAAEKRQKASFIITPDGINVLPAGDETQNEAFQFVRRGAPDFTYRERIGKKNDLYIVGGGHCSLALSEIASKMDFRIHIFDDRPDLNTLEKNLFADEITIVDGYELIGGFIPAGQNVYVVVMTLGYASDAVVVRQLLDRDLKYLGVLGSKAKMATLLKQLEKDGYPAERLNNIHAPVGLPIKSHTPDEIAVSIAAEIIAVKNS